MFRSKQYGPDVLGEAKRKPAPPPEVEAVPDLVVEEAETGFCGAVVGWEKSAGGLTVTLEDRHRKRRVFPMAPGGFLLEGRPVTLVRPAPAPGMGRAASARTASGSLAVRSARARVARSSRIYVEGKHDAELVEKVWGDDLRIEGVVVEYLEGVDDLPAIVERFAPGPGRRLGVLVDHLVDGSKESRIAQRVADSPTGRHVLVVGHPYIDIWEAVRPASLAIPAWPRVPRGTPWKEGVCAALGWPDDTRLAWRRVLGAVHSFRDLEPELLGRVEELIDFVTALGADED